MYLTPLSGHLLLKSCPVFGNILSLFFCRHLYCVLKLHWIVFCIGFYWFIFRLLMLRCGKKFASPRGPTARVEYEMANRDTNSPRTPGNHYPPPNNNQPFNLPEAGVNAKPYPAQPPNPRQDNRRETQHSRWPVANQGGPHNEAYIREGFPPITSPRQGTSLPPRDATCWKAMEPITVVNSNRHEYVLRSYFVISKVREEPTSSVSPSK